MKIMLMILKLIMYMTVYVCKNDMMTFTSLRDLVIVKQLKNKCIFNQMNHNVNNQVNQILCYS